MIRLEATQIDDRVRVNLMSVEDVEGTVILMHDGSDLIIKVTRNDESATGSVKLEVV